MDTIDPLTAQTGDALGEYIRTQLSRCTQLLAVVSTSTKTSWWVPWEIGISTEKDYPIATYAGEYCDLPIYLKKWPYLRSEADLDTYAQESKRNDETFRRRVREFREELSKARAATTKDFHDSLRKALRQS